MSSCYEKTIRTWKEFLGVRGQYGFGWIFRGQAEDWPLTSSLERAFRLGGVALKKAPAVEKQLVRDFQRQYDGEDRDTVIQDTLYCLALMQHHGAPTRLLDWSYSPFVAAFFALESSGSDPVVWCLNGEWSLNAVRSIVPDIDVRNVDKSRKDETFVQLFIKARSKFVFPENPYRFHRRLITQQGVFLCPGDMASPFTSNLEALAGWQQKANVAKLKLRFSRRSRKEALADLFAMNISRATLFPGLDGFAQSLKQRLPYYETLASSNTGEDT